MKRKHQLRLWFAWINIPIGILYGFLIFSIIPMTYGFMGTIVTLLVVSMRPKTSMSSFILVYWVIFTILLSFGPHTIWWPILFEPFRDLNRTFGQDNQKVQLLFVLISVFAAIVYLARSITRSIAGNATGCGSGCGKCATPIEDEKPGRVSLL